MTDIIGDYLDDRTTVNGEKEGYPGHSKASPARSGYPPPGEDFPSSGYPPPGQDFPDEKAAYPDQGPSYQEEKRFYEDEKPRYPDYPNEKSDPNLLNPNPGSDDNPFPIDRKASVPERSRWPPLTRMLMSGEMSGEPPRNLTAKERFDVWMVNEGYRRLFVVVFALVHVMIFAFAFLNFDLKDNLSGARTTFGITYPIARSAALVLHFDAGILLFRKCFFSI